MGALTSAGHGDFGKGERELMGVEFSPAKGGVVSETRHRVKSSRGDFMDHKVTKAVHTSLADVTRHLKTVMGDCFSKEEDD